MRVLKTLEVRDLRSRCVSSEDPGRDPIGEYVDPEDPRGDYVDLEEP